MADEPTPGIPDAPGPAPEQARYARVLDVSTKAGFVALVAGFIAYMLGWLETHVPVEDLPRVWGLPLAEYVARTDTPTGWGWVAHLHKGEFAGLAGIAALAGCSAICVAAILPAYLGRGDRIYAILCALLILILLLAGSGILTGGH